MLKHLIVKMWMKQWFYPEMEENIMRITFNRACERIYKHYGKEDVLQIRKPDRKSFYVVDLVEGTVILEREDLIRM